ncbi:glycoside hydrolase family 68 protein [Convivina intestini]|nr:glycoside hydrolase family 68 protein [Convivina intestini]
MNRNNTLNHSPARLHFKMYKSGKFWLVSGISVFTLGLGSSVAAADNVETLKEPDTTTTYQQKDGLPQSTSIALTSAATLQQPASTSNAVPVSNTTSVSAIAITSQSRVNPQLTSTSQQPLSEQNSLISESTDSTQNVISTQTSSSFLDESNTPATFLATTSTAADQSEAVKTQDSVSLAKVEVPAVDSTSTDTDLHQATSLAHSTNAVQSASTETVNQDLQVATSIAHSTALSQSASQALADQDLRQATSLANSTAASQSIAHALLMQDLSQASSLAESTSISQAINETGSGLSTATAQDKLEKTVGYLTKGAPIFADVQGSDIIDIVNDHNVPATVEQKNIINNRIPVSVDNLNGYIDQSSVSSQPLNFYDDYGYSHFTRQNMDSVIANHPQSQQVPFLNSDQVKNIASIGNMDTWDSWPLTNPDGTVADYHGYRVMFALCGEPDSFVDTDIYLFYQKNGTQNQGADSWKLAGKVFENYTEGTTADQSFIHQSSQNWSGSAALIDPQSDDMRLLYTTVRMDAVPGVTDTYPNQALATANLKVLTTENGLVIDHAATSDRKVIFSGDSKIYETYDQFLKDGVGIDKGNNEFAMRDPHFVEHDGKYYLVFESNTGTDSGAQGLNNLYNMAYYGGTYEQNKLVQEDIAKSNYWSHMVQDNNNVLGLVELDNDFNVKNINKPLLGANAVTDEIERANLFEHKGKWYLFGVTRDGRFASSDADPGNVHLLGFVADSFDGPYKPLNGNGSVLEQNLGQPDLNYTYSYLILNNGDDNNDTFVVLNYVHERFNLNKNDVRATFAPNFLIKIDGDTTSVVDTYALPQGALIDDGSGYVPIQPGIHQKPGTNNAGLSCVTPIPGIPTPLPIPPSESTSTSTSDSGSESKSTSESSSTSESTSNSGSKSDSQSTSTSNSTSDSGSGSQSTSTSTSGSTSTSDSHSQSTSTSTSSSTSTSDSNSQSSSTSTSNSTSTSGSNSQSTLTSTTPGLPPTSKNGVNLDAALGFVAVNALLFVSLNRYRRRRSL